MKTMLAVLHAVALMMRRTPIDHFGACSIALFPFLVSRCQRGRSSSIRTVLGDLLGSGTSFRWFFACFFLLVPIYRSVELFDICLVLNYVLCGM